MANLANARRPIAPSRVRRSLSNICLSRQVLAARVPDPADAPLTMAALELECHIHTKVGVVQDVLAGELSARLAALNQQGQLLEGLFGTSGVEAGDRAGVAEVDPTLTATHESNRCVY